MPPDLTTAAPVNVTFGPLDYVLFFAYLGGIVALGVSFVRHEKGTEDFFVAGRRLPWWAVGISIFGTQLSAITFMSIPAKAYQDDWINIVSNVCILLIAPVIVLFFVPVFRRSPIVSAYEYLETRFGKPVRAYGAIAFVVMQAGRMGIVLFLPAIALAEVTGFHVIPMILLMGVLVIIYTVLGGIEAVIWTDVIQVVVLLGGALLSLFVILADVDGGLPEVLRVANESDKFRWADWSWDPTRPALWIAVIGNLFFGLIPYGSDQAVIQRYLTARTDAQARQAVWVNAILSMPASLLFFFLGTALFVFYHANPDRITADTDPERIFPFFIVQELHGGLAGLLLAGLFAAAMSTLDSSMNSVATVCVNDFYRVSLRPDRTDRHYLFVARGLTVFWGMLATGIAISLIRFQGSIFDGFLAMLGLLGSGLAGVFCLGIFTKRAHTRGALLGAVVSATVMSFVWWKTDLHFFGYAPLGILSCCVPGYVASLLIPGPRR